jgi:hypothetical protein
MRIPMRTFWAVDRLEAGSWRTLKLFYTDYHAKQYERALRLNSISTGHDDTYRVEPTLRERTDD